MRKPVLTSLVFVLVICSTLLHATPDRPTACPSHLDAVRADFVAASNKLGSELLAYRYAADIQAKPNIFLSPLGVSVALGMIANGAAGDSLTQTGRLIGINHHSLSDHNLAVQKLVDEYRSLPGGEKVRLGKSLWGDQAKFEFAPDYVNRIGIGSPALNRDFSQPITVEEINSMVKAQSGGMIPKVLDRIPAHMMAMLINVLYFQAPWRDEFPDWARDEPFSTRDGQSVSVPTMNHPVLWSPYFEDAKVQIISLRFAAIEKPVGSEFPYQTDSRFVLDLILPKAPDSIDNFVRDFTPAKYSAWTSALKTKTIALKVPKFKLSDGGELSSALSSLGLQDIFDSARAQLGGIGKVKSGVNLVIDSILQKVAVEMDENGFKAAAATMVMGGAVSIPQIDATMHVDHPFVFVLRDTLSGLVLFEGVITNPVTP